MGQNRRIRFTSQVVIGDDGQTSTESWAYVYDPVGNLVEKGNAYSVSADGTITKYVKIVYARFMRGLHQAAFGSGRHDIETGKAS